MTGVLSNAHRDHRILGEPMTGFAEEERPIQYPSDVELFIIHIGAEGGMYARSVPTFGGEVMYRLQPESPQVAWAIRQRLFKDNADRMGIRHRIYSATEFDRARNFTARLEGGLLLRCPQVPESGVTFEFVIRYELIVPNPDGATWPATLSSLANA